MAPPGQDCFYVLVPVPNNLSNINWHKEGEKFKQLIINKMSEQILPNLKENITADFYVTPDYFENDLQLCMALDFRSSPNSLSRPIFDFIINLKFLTIFILWVQEHILVLVFQV